MKLLRIVLAYSLSAPVLCAATPAEETARKAAIARTADEIQAECQRNAGGDWLKWDRQLVEFRKELTAKLDQALANPRTSPDGKTKGQMVKVDLTPPIWGEALGMGYVNRWFNAQPLDEFVASRNASAVVAAMTKWLRERNIDLIMVPVPKVAEVYPDRLADYVPDDHIAAIGERKLMLNMLDSGLEVVDLLPAYLQARRESHEPLFYSADSHWNDRAQRIAAQDIVARLKRYAFVRSALAQPARFKAGAEVTVRFQGSAWQFLTPQEQQEIGSGVTTRAIPVISASTGKPVQPAEDAPILIMGDSYATYSRTTVCDGSGILPQIALGTNLPISSLSIQGGNTEPAKEILRDPDIVEKTKVIVWIVNAAEFNNPWEMPKVLNAK